MIFSEMKATIVKIEATSIGEAKNLCFARVK